MVAAVKAAVMSALEKEKRFVLKGPMIFQLKHYCAVRRIAMLVATGNVA